MSRSSDVTDSFSPEQMLGRKLNEGEYQIQRHLGQSTLGENFLGVHSELKIPLVLKQGEADQPLPESVVVELNAILRGTALRRTGDGWEQHAPFPRSGGAQTDRFLREALILARLQHAAIPTLYDYFAESGNWYLVVDYVPGKSFYTYLAQSAPLAPAVAIKYALQLCDILKYLHQQDPPIIFRNLKPESLILSPSGTLILIDFALARYRYRHSIITPLAGNYSGYDSPEESDEEDLHIDERADLYSLGILLLEMLTGQQPNTRTPHEALTQARNLLAPTLCGLLTLATQADPEYRFQSAGSFAQALELAGELEEQRLYRLACRPSLSGPTMPDLKSRQKVIDSVEEKAQTAQTFLLNRPFPSLEQRHQLRAALQQSRQERLEKEDFEIQLASVDESLERRSSTLAQLPLARKNQTTMKKKPPEKPAMGLQNYSYSHRKLRYILLSVFVLTLALFLTLTALLASNTTNRRHQPISKARTVLSPVPTMASPSPSISPSSSASTPAIWQILPSLPFANADNTALFAQVKGKPYIYLTGGFRGGKHAQGPYDHNLYRYSILEQRWEVVEKSPLPGMVNNAAATSDQMNGYFTSGYSTQNYRVSSFLYSYQFALNTMDQFLPPEDIHFGFGNAMIMPDANHLYLTQGFMQAGDANAEAGTGWFRYDLLTQQWHTMAPLPLGLGYSMLIPDAKQGILLLGGAHDAGQTQQSNSIYRYDPQTNRWSLLGSTLPVPLSGTASCLVNADTLIILGGFDGHSQQAYNQVWRFSTKTLAWQQITSLPFSSSVMGAAACDQHGHVYLFRGASDLQTPTQDFVQFTLPEQPAN